MGVSLGFGTTGLRALAAKDDRLHASLEGQTLTVTGRVDDLPRATALGWRFVFEVERAERQGLAVDLPRRVLLNWVSPGAPAEQSGSAPRAGERWKMNVRLRRPHGLANPHATDPELWMWEQGLGASGYVRMGRNDLAPQRLTEASWGVQTLRERVRASIWAGVADARVAGVLAALVVGDQAAIERADWDLFRDTGVAHLMSISGLHITLWAWLTTLAVARIWRWAPRLAPDLGSRLLLSCPAPVAAGIVGWLLAWGYAVFSGWGVPAQRTVVMLGVVVALRLSGRFWPWPVVALAAMVAVLVWDPWALWQAGFWLSFVAVSVLMAGGRTEPHPASVSRRGVHTLLTLWREQLLITVALAPLSLVLFGQVSLVGLVANMVAIPLVTLVVTPLALSGTLLPVSWDAAATVLQGFMHTLAWLATWPSATLAMHAVPWGLALPAVAGGVWLCLRLPGYLRALGIACVVPALLFQPWRPAEGEFELVAADVGQGSAVVVRTAHGSVVVDAGPVYGPGHDAGRRVLLPLLRAMGDAPNHLVFSHRDSDHVGGAAALLAAFPSARVWASFDHTELLGRWGAAPLSAAERQQPNPPQWTRCLAGQQWELDGVRFDVMHPTPELYGAGNTPSNNLSCVVWVRGKSASALITGDLEAAHEATLVRAHPEVRAELLMAPHHGSATSSSPDLLSAVRPQQVLVQAGYRNRYGHPAVAVTGRYASLGLPWVATPECGAARWRSDQPASLTCQRTLQARYWHWEPALGAPKEGDIGLPPQKSTEVDVPAPNSGMDGVTDPYGLPSY